MKKIIFALTIATVAFVSCKKGEDASSKINTEGVVTETTTGDNASAEAQDGTPVATFSKVEHDFGTIKKGTKNETEFEITNTGNADLIIINASASCGCTVPEYPKTPIKPGATDKIKVSFSANNAGAQSKTVTLTTNTANGTETLSIKANVEE